jgi:hypothetical protein
VYVAWNVAVLPEPDSEESARISLLAEPDPVVVVVVLDPAAVVVVVLDAVVVVVGAALGLLEPHAASTMPKPSSAASAVAVLS